ncbi:hypothetical protein D3C85_1499150 [compost metagenome]
MLLARHLLGHLQLRKRFDQRSDIHLAVAITLWGKVQPLLRLGFREQVIGRCSAQASVTE